MSKSVKTIVQVASLAAGAWGAAQLISGGAAAAGAAAKATGTVAPAAATTTGVGTAAAAGAGTAASAGGLKASLASVGKGLLESKALQVASLGAQGITQVQSKLAADEAQDAQREQERLQGLVQEREAQRARIQQIRQERIQRGSVVARAASVGGGTAPAAAIGGASSIQGGLGALGMQTASNINEINFGSSSSRAIGAAMGDRYSAQTEQQGWQNLGQSAQNIFTAAPGVSAGLKNIFNIA
jgi:hypothetical protein